MEERVTSDDDVDEGYLMMMVIMVMMMMPSCGYAARRWRPMGHSCCSLAPLVITKRGLEQF